jgi:1-acyl-sn-glycerol-3-phosphate acyltransferase
MKRGKISRSPFNLIRILSRLILYLTGWRTQSANIDFPKYILIGVPHTSNWDFVIGYMAMSAIGLKLSWIGKHTLFRGPFGWLLYRMGGIPVNRNLSTNFVDQVVTSFNEYERQIVAIAPEGTRKHTQYWKSGFYYIALKAKIPIVFGFVDYGRRLAGTGDFLIPSGQLERDLLKLRKFYEKIIPKFPDNFGEINLPMKK